ncbi:DUF2381 family protein [Archangium lansingense]|uniref:DUF2381 family protein n=1 Tax=Archangium lansingense TaxID=2995310 RepID=A0ABT4A3C8_9BACT|nr:DUF2381 family protein [Archangium lansinium]MCY1076156.1 DUF2381 family protein [Archangium lansinium]
MHHPLLFRFPLLLVLVASEAVPEVCEPTARTLILSEHPRSEAPKVYVGGQTATLLRLEKDCDPERTNMLGWKGHFEPLICHDRFVLLYPLRDLTPSDRFLLQVTLKDGTELPFIVTARQQSYGNRQVDQQVNVFESREGYDAVLSSLYRALEDARELREKNERHRKEENSVDHAYATLLANGAVKAAPFRLEKTITLKDGDTHMVIKLFSGKGKAAVLVNLTNTYSNEPWTLGETRLSADLSSRTARAFALRMNPSEIIPGASGSLAVVADKSAFVSQEGLVDLTLEIFRGDGLQQVAILLDRRLIR